jgi:polar amino acid transport system substrate-binding protein
MKTSRMPFVAASLMLLTLVAAGCGATAGTGSGATPGTGSSATPSPVGPSATILAELAPSGKLRVAVQTPPPFLAQKDASSGAYKGVAVAMATALAANLGVPLEIVEVDAPPQILAGAGAGKWDIAFLAVTPATAQAVDLTAPFILVAHTFIVRADSAFQNITDADKPGVRIGSVKDAPHTPVLAAYLKQAQLVTVDESGAIAMLKAGQIDAYADNRFSLVKTASQDPSLRVLDGDFFVAKLAVAVAKGDAEGLAYLTQFVEQAKSSGMVQKAIDATGLALTVAPAQ